MFHEDKNPQHCAGTISKRVTGSMSHKLTVQAHIFLIRFTLTLTRWAILRGFTAYDKAATENPVHIFLKTDSLFKFKQLSASPCC